MIKRIALLTLAAVAVAQGQAVNCLVAVVNGRPVTLHDVDVTAAFGLIARGRPAAEELVEARRAALDTLIERRVVLDLVREARTVETEEVAAALADVRRRLGAEVFEAGLRRFGLTAAGLEPYVRDMLLFEKALSMRFTQAMPISTTDVERHYRTVYLAERTRLDLPPEPLARVAGEIEARLREERRARQMDEWLKDVRKRAEVRIYEDCLRSR